MADPRLVKELVDLRRILQSSLKLVELQLGREKAICRHCFFQKGLTDRCECDRRYLHVGVSA